MPYESYEIVDTEFVLDNLDNMPIIDVRPFDIYEEGHIPGAISVDLPAIKEAAQEENEDVAENFKNEVEEMGIMPDDECIVYCMYGPLAREACEYLESMGYKNLYCYEESYVKWVSDPSRPIER